MLNDRVFHLQNSLYSTMHSPLNFSYQETSEIRMQAEKLILGIFYIRKTEKWKTILWGSLELKWGSSIIWSVAAQERPHVFPEDRSQGCTVSSGTKSTKNKIAKTLEYTKTDSMSFNHTVFIFFFLFRSFVCLNESGIWKIWVLNNSFLQVFLKQSKIYGLTRSH